VLSATAKDFSQYMQRKELTKNTAPVKTVMDESLYKDTSSRFEQLTQDRRETKALHNPMRRERAKPRIVDYLCT
jgi:hypothetical protein